MAGGYGASVSNTGAEQDGTITAYSLALTQLSGGPDEIQGYSPDETRVDKGTKEEVAGLNGNFGTNYIGYTI
ncbi:hypothetical protein NDU88_002512 [Pleurodeles waltl]|uniref:Uncharacterized protein n=1 Tax=Pleurodeles waltl TaxID=8319 RepID=A0AAV7VBH6_PLEWA|nr:hypothetical protein NDU88_002512 [Pleurodeles waltl]